MNFDKALPSGSAFLRIVFVMGFKTNLFALSDELPRTNILNYPPASAEETLAQLDKIWPGKFAFDSEETIEDGHNWYFHAVAFGSTLLFGTDDVYDLIEDPALANDPRESWSLCINSVVDFCHYKTPTRELEASCEDYDFDMQRFFSSGRLLDFEVPFANGEHVEVLHPTDVAEWEQTHSSVAPKDKNGEVSYLFHPLELGNAAVKWIFGIEGETPLQDSVMDSLPDCSHVNGLPMYNFVERR